MFYDRRTTTAEPMAAQLSALGVAMWLAVAGCGTRASGDFAPLQTGGVIGSPCAPPAQGHACLAGGNARVRCDATTSTWALEQACAAGTFCAETVDAATLLKVSECRIIATADTQGGGDDAVYARGGGGADGGKKLGCLDGNPHIACTARIAVTDAAAQSKAHNATVTIPAHSLKTGDFKELKLTISNVAQLQSAAELRLLQVSLAYSAKSAQEVPPALQCFGGDGVTPCDKVAWLPIVPEGAQKTGAVTQAEIIIRYTHHDNTARSADLLLDVAGDDARFLAPFQLKIDTKPGHAKLVLPDLLAFGQVPPLSTVCKEFSVANTGDAWLEIDKIDFLADGAFTLKAELNDGAAKQFAPGGPVLFDPPLAIAAQTSHKMTVCVAPKDLKKKQGSLTFHSNDPAPANEGQVPLLANATVPCMQLEPASKQSFGGVEVGKQAVYEVKIKACGGDALAIDHIDFVDVGNSNEFSLKFGKTAANYPNVDPKTGPSVASQLVVPVNAEAVFEVVYTPQDESPLDVSNDLPVVDAAEIKVSSNAFEAKNVIVVDGFGVLPSCPIAKIAIQEGEWVLPQTLLHLKGDASTGDDGALITTYAWTAKQPAGSVQVFSPGPGVANPTFTANVVGDYVFCLEVTDANGKKSCATTCATVHVIAEEAIHIELLWTTPADANPADTGPSAGADMDLHFAHSEAAGPDIDCDGTGDPWFNTPLDTFWFNPNPNWGTSMVSADDDPSLDLDDTDGAGPENLNFGNPEGTMTKPAFYHVGAHYWNDNGFGSSQAKVNVYIFGTLALQIPSVTMAALDMWHVGKIHWPNKITDKAAANVEPVVLCYQTGDPCQGGKRWVAQGSPCVSKCYNHPGMAAAGSGASMKTCKK